MPESGKDAGPRKDALQLQEELTIADCDDYYQQLVSRIEQGGDIILDGSAVTRIDTAFIQLLYLVQRTLMETDSSLQWQAISPAIDNSVRLLGLSEQLALVDTA